MKMRRVVAGRMHFKRTSNIETSIRVVCGGVESCCFCVCVVALHVLYIFCCWERSASTLEREMFLLRLLLAAPASVCCKQL